MGYRTYIASMSKEVHNRIKGFTLDELYKDNGLDINDEMNYLGVYDILDKCLYEFGKYTEFDDEKYYTKVFDNEDTNKHFLEEHDLWIFGKEYLEHIINFYKDLVAKYYNEMMIPFFGEGFDSSEFLNTITRDYKVDGDDISFDFTKITQKEVNALWRMMEHVRSMRTEWVQLTPFNLEKGSEVTTSWKYEYSIFELVNIYKSFDWDNNLMIYYGY